jgi:hypothetical protein
MKNALLTGGKWMRLIIKTPIPTLENLIDAYNGKCVLLNGEVERRVNKIRNTIKDYANKCKYSKSEDIYIIPISLNCIYGSYIEDLENNSPFIIDWNKKFFPGVMKDDFNNFILISFDITDPKVKDLINFIIENYESYCINNENNYYSDIIICDKTTKKIIGTK